MDDYFPRMTEAKPPRFSLDGEFERLRLELRDKDLLLITANLELKELRTKLAQLEVHLDHALNRP